MFSFLASISDTPLFNTLFEDRYAENVDLLTEFYQALGGYLPRVGNFIQILFDRNK
jgi:hypothetical protein